MKKAANRKRPAVNKIYYIYVGILAVLFFIFHTIPFLKGVFYSFTDWRGYGEWNFVGLRNYLHMFVDAAKDFVSFMMEKENIQTYIDEQFSFSALKGVEQSDEAVSGVQEDISNGKVANFEDHYYPSGLDMAALVAEFSLNRANGMDDKENIDQFLKQCDEKYDVANVD